MNAIRQDTGGRLRDLYVEDNSRIAIFGLSANPPTYRKGHYEIIKMIVGTNKFSHVIILPVYEHMFSKKLLDFEHRMRMCNLCFANMSTETCLVQVMDIERTVCREMSSKDPPQRAGTIDVVDYFYRELRIASRGIELHLVLGKDSYRDLLQLKWKMPLRLIELTHLEVFERCTVDFDSVSVPVRVTFHQMEDAELYDVSSTLAREFLRSRRYDEARSLLHEDVFQYIMDNSLYENLENSPVVGTSLEAAADASTLSEIIADT